MCVTARLTAVHGVVCLTLALSYRTGERVGKVDVTNGTIVRSPALESSLQSLAGFWSYNESLDISKYEDFDHNRIIGVAGLSYDRPAEAEAPPSADDPSEPRPPRSGDTPAFDNSLVTNVTVQLGSTAFLQCRVRNANDLRVSWVRRRDWHILSSGSLIYTNDERFSVLHSDSSADWDLQIRFVQRRDSGTYECQVATSLGMISHYYNLQVAVPSAVILGGTDYHIGEGSTVSLVCIIENSPIPPQYVFWYRNSKILNYDSTRGGVTVSTEPGPKTHSRLVVSSASSDDSGNYTCMAPNTEPDTVHVYVTKGGENTAAIQRPESNTASSNTHLIISQCLPALLVLFYKCILNSFI